MFSYYGSKSKIAHLYPAPKHGVIVEPFAGSARYSLLHFENDIFLYDLSDTVVGVWNYLISASPGDILGLPDAPNKVHIDDFAPALTQPERDLIGFHLCRGKAVPRKTGHGQNGWTQDKQRIAKNLFKIRHWKIEKRSFATVPNRLATHFIAIHRTKPRKSVRVTPIATRIGRSIIQNLQVLLIVAPALWSYVKAKAPIICLSNYLPKYQEIQITGRFGKIKNFAT